MGDTKEKREGFCQKNLVPLLGCVNDIRLDFPDLPTQKEKCKRKPVEHHEQPVPFRRIRVLAGSVVIKGKTNKLIAAAYQIISTATYSQRYARYADLLIGRGHITVDGVRITDSGYLEKGSTRVNLKIAKNRGFLGFGTYASFGLNSKYKPRDVIAGENGLGVFSDKIVFSVKEDTDVIFDLIAMVAE